MQTQCLELPDTPEYWGFAATLSAREIFARAPNARLAKSIELRVASLCLCQSWTLTCIRVRCLSCSDLWKELMSGIERYDGDNATIYRTLFLDPCTGRASPPQVGQGLKALGVSPCSSLELVALIKGLCV